MAREMKDSGIEWIGEIPEAWDIAKLSFFFDIQLGKMLQPEQNSENDTYESYLCAANVGGNKLKLGNLKQMWFSPEEKRKFFVHKGDLLVVEGGDVASCAIIDSDVDNLYIQNALHRVRSLVGFDIRLLKYYLMIAKETGHIDLICNKATIAHFTKEKFGSLPYIVIPIRQQKRIADYLDNECSRIDAVIEQTRASIEEYKKLKQAVITQAVTKGIRPGRQMKDSGVNWVKEIPEEWAVIPAKYLFGNSDVRKQDGDEQMTASQQYGIITQKRYMELSGSSIVFANKSLEDWKHVEPYDFVISLRSFQGGLEMSETSGCITWHYIVLKASKPVYSYYYKWLFKSELYIKALQRTCNFIRDGQDLRYSNFIQVPLFEPSIDEQKEIADYLNNKTTEIDEIIRKKERFVSSLESYKKSLIYEYVTGKKEVPA